MDAGVTRSRRPPHVRPESHEVESQILHDAFRQATDRLIGCITMRPTRTFDRAPIASERLHGVQRLGQRSQSSEPPTEPVAVAAVSSSNSNEQSQSAVATARQAASSSPRLALVRPNRPERDRIGGVKIPAGSTWSNG
jgi:hypothetical protein